MVSLVCTHYGSLLVLSASEREEIYLANGQITGADDLREMVLEYRVQAHRAEIISRWQGSETEPPPEAWIENRLATFADALRGSLTIGDARCIQVEPGIEAVTRSGRFGIRFRPVCRCPLFRTA